VTRGPSRDPHDKRLAVEVEDHPLEYGDFEGVIPQGEYGGGTVQLWDRGYWLSLGDPHEGLKKGDLKFILEGERLHGSWVLVRMRWDRNGGKRTNWLLIKHRTPPPGKAMPLTNPKQSPPVVVWTRSRRQGQAPTPHHAQAKVSFGGPKVKNPAKADAIPRSRPQLCKLVRRATTGQLGHEISSALSATPVENGTQLRTRKNRLDRKFGGMAGPRHAPRCLLGGEVVALDKRRPDFRASGALPNTRPMS
jgi:bifunctional non-homologous end joining protein LigD